MLVQRRSDGTSNSLGAHSELVCGLVNQSSADGRTAGSIQSSWLGILPWVLASSRSRPSRERPKGGSKRPRVGSPGGPRLDFSGGLRCGLAVGHFSLFGRTAGPM